MNRILLADDHDLVRETLTEYLKRQGEFAVAQARCLTSALELVADQRPFDLILLDYTMPGMDALNGLARMRVKCSARVAILSGTAPADVAHRSLRAGACGFLPKTLAPQDLLGAVHVMLGGEVFCPEELLEGFLEEEHVQLTPRERDVLCGVTQGKLNKEIAWDLDIQEVTVKLHVKTLSRKLSAKNRTHAAMLARDLGLV